MVIDVLMITHQRSHYTRLALERLLQTCDDHMRVWVWHNGDDLQTLDVVRQLSGHSRFYKFYHSEENRKLTAPTNWMWSQGEGEYVAKVDDDCLVPLGWGQTFREAHQANANLGAICCWGFPDEDYDPKASKSKVRAFRGGHRMLQHPWIQGSGYVMKRRCLLDEGLLKEGESFPAYVRRLSWRGWINGWYFPFLYQEHMDDPRAENTLLKCDKDLELHMPLTALKNGVSTILQWESLIKETARQVQNSSVSPGKLFYVRSVLYRLLHPRRGVSYRTDVV